MHFKGKLVINASFFKAKRMALWLLIPGSIAIGLLFSGKMTDSLWFPLFIAAYLVILFFRFRIDKTMLGTSSHVLEIDDQEIRLLDDRKQVYETILLKDVAAINLQYSSVITDETITETVNELRGRGSRNNIHLRMKNGKERRLYFLIESHYMREQLKKLEQTWQKQQLVSVTAG
jgi:hypothetical protein